MRWATLALATGVVITLVIGIPALIFFTPRPSVIRIDCSMASFHPDFTPAMRKACQDRHKQVNP